MVMKAVFQVEAQRGVREVGEVEDRACQVDVVPRVSVGLTVPTVALTIRSVQVGQRTEYKTPCTPTSRSGPIGRSAIEILEVRVNRVCF